MRIQAYLKCSILRRIWVFESAITGGSGSGKMQPMQPNPDPHCSLCKLVSDCLSNLFLFFHLKRVEKQLFLFPYKPVPLFL